MPQFVEQTNHSKAVVRAMKGNIVKLMDKMRFKWNDIPSTVISDGECQCTWYKV